MLQDQIRQFINELSTVLSTIERTKNDVLLAGYFNINRMKLNENETCSEFFDSLLAHSVLPQITLPTRFGQFSHTLIDNFFFKYINLAHKTIAGVFPKKLSDLQPYVVLIDIKLTKERTSKYIQITIQTEMAMEKVKNELIELFFCRVLHTIFSHLRAHAFARSVTVARSSAVQASSSRRQERRRAIVCGPRSRNPPTGRRRESPISSSLFSHSPPLCAVG